LPGALAAGGRGTGLRRRRPAADGARWVRARARVRASETPPDLISQARSRFRLRLTFWLGLAMVGLSAVALAWLLELTPRDRGNALDVNLSVVASCPFDMTAHVALDPHQGTIRAVLEPVLEQDLGATASRAHYAHRYRAMFRECSTEVTTQHEIRRAWVPELPHDYFGSATGTAPAQPLEVETTDDTWLRNQRGPAHTLRIDRESAPHFFGEVRLEPAHWYRETGYGRYVMAVSVSVTNFHFPPRRLNALTTSIALPAPGLRAREVRPSPESLTLAPVETDLYSADPDDGIGSTEDYRLEFVDPEASRNREALLILASTLFGAGIAALFEAFLAGGTAAMIGRRP
ncbi:MAG: hypothetical protein AAF568_06510, partial [Pseudomonadota bacterium]